MKKHIISVALAMGGLLLSSQLQGQVVLQALEVGVFNFYQEIYFC